MANFLSSLYPLAKRHIGFNSSTSSLCRLFFKDAHQFSIEISAARHQTLSSDIDRNSTIAAQPNISNAKAASAKNRVSVLSLRIQQWVPSK
eukprot:4913465-Karenia_brevis.AAC.1